MMGIERSHTDLLKQLVSLQDQTRNRMEPDVTDIQRMRLGANRTFTTAFTYGGNNITGNSTTPTNGALSFQLSNATDYQSWLACFDSYRILQVHLEFVPASIGVTGTTTTNGVIYTCLDYGDATVLDATGILQYDTCQIVNSPQFFERRLVPRVAKALYGGVTFTSYGQDTRPWIDSNSPNVQHYGLKYSQTVTSSAVTSYTVQTTLFVQFRNSR